MDACGALVVPGAVVWKLCTYQFIDVPGNLSENLPKILFYHHERCSGEESGWFESTSHSWSSTQRFCSERLQPFMLKPIYRLQ